MRIRLFFTVLVGCSVSAGCFGSGSNFNGERGRTHWQIEDGLCSFFDGCGLDVPLAVGATAQLNVTGVDATGGSATGTGAVTTTSFSASAPDGGTASANIGVHAVSPGDGVVALLDPAGVEVDQVTLHVRAATSLTCGTVDSMTALDWQMAALHVTDSIAVSMAASDLQVGCRAADASGPLLSVDAIHWAVTSGTSVLGLQVVLGPPATSTTGARIYLHGISAGTATLRVTIGTVTHDLSVAVGP